MGKNFYLCLTLREGYEWWIRGDQIVAITQLTFQVNSPRSRVLLKAGHTGEVMETAREILERWAEARGKAYVRDNPTDE